MELCYEKSLYYFLIGLMSAIAVFSLGFTYIGVQGHLNAPAPRVSSVDSIGQTKPLPDFIVDRVPKDELESLKL